MQYASLSDPEVVLGVCADELFQYISSTAVYFLKLSS